MRANTLTFIFLTLAVICQAQVERTRYFKDGYLRKETRKEKAKYAEIVIENPDSSVTTSVKDLLKNEVTGSHTYKGAEPVGIWIYMYSSGPMYLDYSFPLRYSNATCPESSGVKINDYFIDDDAIGYKAPVLSTGESMFMKFLAKNTVYPRDALWEGIQGKVQVIFTITKDGKIENVYVQKGANILLDKEAVRVIRKIKLSSPPTLKGQSQEVCVSVPLAFKID